MEEALSMCELERDQSRDTTWIEPRIRTTIMAAQNGAALTRRQILDNAGFPGVPVPDHNVPIYAAHVRALRNDLDVALASVQIATAAYRDSPTSPTSIKVLHITQLQQRAQ
jgi:hypothetical protein